MRHFTRITGAAEIGPIVAELEHGAGMWLADTSRQRNVRCQRNTQNIFLRAAVKPLPPGAANANDVHDSRTTPMAEKFPLALRYCARLADSMGGRLARATLVGLLPRSEVFPHVDIGEYYRLRDRYHLVLRSPGGSEMWAGDEHVVMREGELWVFDNKVKHWSKNASDDLRVHLIFDILPAAGRGYYSPGGSGTL